MSRQPYSQLSLGHSETVPDDSQFSSVASNGHEASVRRATSTGRATQRAVKEPSVGITQEQQQKPLLNRPASDNGDANHKPPALSQPFWLSKGLFTILIIVFTALWVALIVLWGVVTSRNGLSLTVTTSHYAWTYGPTAILVVLVSIWRQVDYHCKATQPWREMVTGCPTPDRSILLDYISPMQILDVCKSFRFRHSPVALTTTGFFIMKLIILVSTTVFVLKPTSRLETRPIQYTASFTTQDLWDKLLRKVGTWAPDAYSEYYQGNKTFLDDVVMEYSQELYGRPTDATRITNNMLFQPFNSLLESDFISVAAAVDVFAPLISCEIAQVSLVRDKMYTNDWRLKLVAAHAPAGRTEYQTTLTQSFTTNLKLCRPSCIAEAHKVMHESWSPPLARLRHHIIRRISVFRSPRQRFARLTSKCMWQMPFDATQTIVLS
jgi:Protein of unknown function (DUF3433)